MSPTGNVPTRFIIAFVLLILVLSGFALADMFKGKGCPDEQKLMTGQCLPEGQCVGPNDAIVECKTPKTDAN